MFKRLDLPYKLDALDPYMSSEQLDYHYNKHHLAYETSLNKALEKVDLPTSIKSLEDLVKNYLQLPDNLHIAVRQFGGGLINHNLYFSILGKDSALKPGTLHEEINKTFGSYEELKTRLIEKAMIVFGSGWTWLVVDRHKKLNIINTFNQDNPWFLGMTPIIGIDVWEHAYYIDYHNDRKKYLENFFNILNWNKIEELYTQAMEK